MSAFDVFYLWTSCLELTVFSRADTFQDGEARGALSWAFIKSLRQWPNQSYLQLLNSIRAELEGKYTQKPQLSCSHPLGGLTQVVQHRFAS